MTDEQINIAIAEVVGWWGNIKLIDGIPFGRPPKITSEYIELPNYCNDLNATHEAEKSLVENPDLYEEWLASVCGGTEYLFRATALQRTEALLRMIGKWEE